MGEVNGVYDGGLNGMEDEERVHEWEFGLPNVDDITPLNHGLVPPELMSAFNIKPEPCRTSGDVTRASEDTISTIRGQSPSSNLKIFDDNQETIADEEIDEVEGEAEDKGSDLKKPRRNESPEDADSADKTLKRPRLVWTPQLHKRFVDVVVHLGIKNAVPKTIMQLMNVEGLTRENVASHLQKYRLYLKRMQGVSFDTPSNSSAPSTEQDNWNRNGNGNGNGHVPMPITMPYGAPSMMPVPVPVPMMGMGHGHMGTGMGMGNYNGFESNHHQYNGMMQTGNKYGSVVSYHHHHPPHVAPGDK